MRKIRSLKEKKLNEINLQIRSLFKTKTLTKDLIDVLEDQVRFCEKEMRRLSSEATRILKKE